MQASAWTIGDLVRATFLSHASQVINIAITLVLTPLVYDRLGPVNYGLWILVLSQVSLLELLDLDLHDSVVRNVTACRAAGDSRLARLIVANALLLAVAIGLLGAAIVAVLSGYVLRDQVLSPEQRNAVPVLLISGLALFWCDQLTAIPTGVMLSAKHYVADEALGVVAAIGNGVLTLVVLWQGGELVALAVAAAISQCFWMALTFAVTRRVVPDLPISFRHVSRDGTAWRPLFSFFAWSTIINLAMTGIHDTDTILLGAVASVGAVAAYEIALKGPIFLGSFTESTFWTIFPYSADLHERDRTDLLQQTLVVGTKLAVVMNAFFLLGAWFVGPLLLDVWIGPIANGTSLLRLGLVVNVIYAGFLIAETLLYGCGQMKPLALIYGVGLLVCVPATAGLILSYGAIGAVLGTALTGTFFLATTVHRVSRFLDYPLGRFLWETIALPTLPALAILLLMVALDRASSGQPAVEIGLGIGACAAYAAATARVAFTAADRSAARRRLATWIARTDAVWNRRLGKEAR
ncbi:MAG TPA: polysaccharide biosynthesis C-terminal domain-containing protein [Thermomicrobiales bacterium]|jgi:O-antigen/teichoic acid export membrane protein